MLRQEDPEFHNLHAQMRCQMIEGALRTLGNRTAGCTAAAVLNVTRSNFHTELDFGGVVVTQSMRHWPGEPLNDAMFRQQYAENYNTSLPGFGIEARTQTQEKTVYAVMIHNEHPLFPGILSFARFVFPDGAGGFVDGEVDLLARFPAVAPHAPTVVAPAAVIAKPNVALKNRSRSS